MEYEGTKRISKGGDSEEKDFPDLLEAASSFARGLLEAIYQVAGTTHCKGVQTSGLVKWAKENGFWIEDINTIGTYTDRGSENEVYISKDGTQVYKLNDYRYSDDNLDAFFDRIEAHNHYFAECSYRLIGFAANSNGIECAVLSQPFIAAEREATNEEISEELARMGFESKLNGEYFTNGVHDVFDALPNNVLYGYDGRLYFIDTILYQSEETNPSRYKRQSPRFSN